MKTQQTEPMNPSVQFCPNERCLARGKVGEGTIRIHDHIRQRYRCRSCKCTFSARRGTMLQGLRKPTELIVIVVTLLAYGCPVQAIVHAYELDDRTVVSATRDTALADRMMAQVRACSRATCALLVCTDGWAAYPKSICRAFRDKVKETTGRGRCGLRIWSSLCIATVIKRAEKKRVVEVTRKMTRGTYEQADRLLKASQGGNALNTAFIERLNGTMRERLASLTRKCRHAARRIEALETGMYLLGCTYNFCFAHHELSKTQHLGYTCTPAMVAGVTAHRWSIQEVLTYKMAPGPWVKPKRSRNKRGVEAMLPKRPRGRPRKHPLPDPTAPKRPRGRPRKFA